MKFDRLRIDLIRDEGNVPHAYQDSQGYWTIGVGFLIDERLGAGLSPAAIDFILDEKIQAVRRTLDRNVPWWSEMPEPARRALANMAYNLGWPRLSTFKRMLAALERHDFDAAAIEALDSKWARDVGPGRSGRIAQLYREAGTQDPGKHETGAGV